MSRRKRTPEVDRLLALYGIVAPGLLPAADEAGKALAFRAGCGREWSERQRRIMAAVVLVRSCTANQAAESLAIMLARNGIDGVDNEAWSDLAVFKALC